MSEIKLQERLREPVISTALKAGNFTWEHAERLIKDRVDAAAALDAAERKELFDEGIIRILTHERDGWRQRADAAEAEIARLRGQAEYWKTRHSIISVQPPAVEEDVVERAWRPIQDHVFPWEPHELIVACFYIGPESELKPEVQILEAYCSKGNYFERSAGRSTGMTTLLEEGWTPFAWLDHATPPAIPSEDEMRAAKEHFRDYLGGEHDTGRANLLRTKDAG